MMVLVISDNDQNTKPEERMKTNILIIRDKNETNSVRISTVEYQATSHADISQLFDF